MVERGVKPVQDSVVERHGMAVDLDDPEVDSVDRSEALLGHDLGGRAREGEPAVLEGADAVGVEGRKVDLVQDEDDGLAELVGEASQEPHHRERVADVEVVRGLVEEDDVGVLGEDHGNEGALALAARHFVDEAVGESLEAHVADGLVDAAPVVVGESRARVRKASESHEFADRDLHLDGVRLGENREASGERAGVPAFDRASVEEHVAVLGGEKACGDAEHGGLARAVGADERRDLSLRDLERDVVDHGNAVVELGERLDGEHGHGGSESFAAKDEVEEVDAAHDRDEDAHGDAEGCEVLDGKLSAREHDDADEDAACDERAVAVGHEEAAREVRGDEAEEGDRPHERGGDGDRERNAHE